MEGRFHSSSRFLEANMFTDSIGLMFACSPDDESCDGQWLLSASPFQLDLENAPQPGAGFEYFESLSRTPPPDTTIKYCDSPYHIVFTNVKTKSRTCGKGVGPHLGWTPRRNSGYLACAPTGGAVAPWHTPTAPKQQFPVQRGTSTIRPETSPCRSCSKTSLTCTKGLVVT